MSLTNAAHSHLSPFADLAASHAISAELDRFVDLLEWLASSPALPLLPTANCTRCLDRFGRLTPAVTVVGIYEDCSDYCAACHDTLGEMQDEEAAS